MPVTSGMLAGTSTAKPGFSAIVAIGAAGVARGVDPGNALRVSLLGELLHARSIRELGVSSSQAP